VKAPTNAKAQASYSLGVSMGDQLHHLGLTADSIATERLTRDCAMPSRARSQ